MGKTIRMIIPNPLSLKIHSNNMPTRQKMFLRVSIFISPASNNTANQTDPFVLVLLAFVAV